jgi:predicted MFS family arabinose efflux permease
VAQPSASQRALVPLYAASAVLTLGEGGAALLIPPYLHLLGIDAAVIGAVLAAYGVASLATRVPAALLYRSHRGPWLVAGGCVLSALAFACIPLTSTPVAVAGLVALDGVGFSMATTGAMTALMERRPPGASAGSIMGWYTGSLGIGYSAAGFVGGTLGDRLGVDAAILALAVVPLLAGALLKLSLDAAPTGAEPVAAGHRPRSRLRQFAHLPALVWLAFLVSLYINLVNGVLFTFFPIHGLAIGLSLTQIGALTGIHGAVAAAVRLGSGLFFRHVSYARSLPLMVVLSGLAVAGLSIVRLFAALAVAWAVIGLARGVLRVASGALVMDVAGDSDAERGAASGVYLAGLDLGKILGPPLGGAGVHLAGIETTFLLIAVAFPAAYLVATAALPTRSRRSRPAGSASRSDRSTRPAAR